jgi:hypothetical protein
LQHTIIQAEQEENFYEVKYKTLTCFGQIIETINKATAGIRFFTWQSEGRHYFGDRKITYLAIGFTIYVHYSIAIEKSPLL